MCSEISQIRLGSRVTERLAQQNVVMIDCLHQIGATHARRYGERCIRDLLDQQARVESSMKFTNDPTVFSVLTALRNSLVAKAVVIRIEIVGP